MIEDGPDTPASSYPRTCRGELLNVVNDPLFEVGWIISEHSGASYRLLYGRFLAGPDSLDEIMLKKSKHAICVHLGDRTLLFSSPSDGIARRAVGYTVANTDVASAEQLMADDAEAAQVLQSQ